MPKTIAPPWLKRPDIGRDLQQLDNRLRGLKGSKLGPASPGRTLTLEEHAAIEANLRKRGIIE